jgi:hypothetical protein
MPGAHNARATSIRTPEQCGRNVRYVLPKVPTPTRTSVSGGSSCARVPAPKSTSSPAKKAILMQFIFLTCYLRTCRLSVFLVTLDIDLSPAVRIDGACESMMSLGSRRRKKIHHCSCSTAKRLPTASEQRFFGPVQAKHELEVPLGRWQPIRQLARWGRFMLDIKIH